MSHFRPAHRHAEDRDSFDGPRPEGSEGESLDGDFHPNGLELLEKILDPAEPRPELIQRTFPSEDLDVEALKIVRRLQRYGFASFLVGGCVRDLLAGLHPKDFDIATAATPRQVKRLFRNCRIIGRRFKLAHIFFRDGKIIEVATFRQAPKPGAQEELLITDDNVFGTPREDAYRRDLTINGLLLDPFTHTIIDFVGGAADIAARTIRSIGDPEVRFQEDPIRMIRALKFAARLGFEIDTADKRALSTYRRDLLKSPLPRLLEETYKILGCGAAADTFRNFKLSGVLQVLLPTLDQVVAAPADGSGPFWKRLAALDVACGGRRIFSNSAMLASIVHPLYEEATAGERGHGSFGHLSRWLGRFFEGCDLLKQVARRDKGKVRLILATWRRLLQDGGPDQRFSVSQFLRREWFEDALAFLKVWNQATGEGAEALARWTARVAELKARQPAAREYGPPPGQDRGRVPPPPPLPGPESRRAPAPAPAPYAERQPPPPRRPDRPRPDQGERFEKQPPPGSHQHRGLGFGTTPREYDPVRGMRTLGFGAPPRHLNAPMGFGDGIRTNTTLMDQSDLGFGDDRLGRFSVLPTGWTGFGESAQFPNRALPKKKLPIIPGVNTPEAGEYDPARNVGRRRGKGNRRRRGGFRSGGGGFHGRPQGHGGGFHGGGGGGGGGSGGGGGGGRGRRRKRRRR